MSFSQPEDGDDEPDFFEAMRNRMAPEHQEAGKALDRVNAVYVDSPRDKAMRQRFDRFLTFVTAKQRHGRRGKGNAFFVTGHSGAGKTDIVEHLLMEHPVMQPIVNRGEMVKPWIRVALQGPATLGVLGTEILAALGYRVKSTMKRAEIWRILPEQLAFNKVFMIHIDETQHLLTRGADTEEVASAIKGLMNYQPFPISFILGGKPALNDLIIHDDQAERRNFSLALSPLDVEEDRKLIEAIIRKLCAPAELMCDNLIKEDMPERIAHAANYQFARICEVIIHGIHHALLDDSAELTREYFARAYRDHSTTDGDDEMNPFFTDDWTTLEPGYFVTEEDSEE